MYLLDTHILLWLEYDVAKVPKSVIEILENPEVAVYFSMASLWETAIKIRLNKQDFDVNLTALYRAIINNGFQEIAINKPHLDIITQLPLHHKDPFDRILIAQAMAENLILITHDEKIWQYDNLKILKI